MKTKEFIWGMIVGALWIILLHQLVITLAGGR